MLTIDNEVGNWDLFDSEEDIAEVVVLEVVGKDALEDDVGTFESLVFFRLRVKNDAARCSPSTSYETTRLSWIDRSSIEVRRAV